MRARCTRRYWTMVSPIPWHRATRRLAINRAAIPLEARQRPCRPDRDECGRRRELPRVLVLASPTRRGLSAAESLLWIMPIAVLGECRGARQSSRRRCIPTPDQLGAMYPLGRMAEISDIVDAILSRLGQLRDGETLPVDGGQSGARETPPCSLISELKYRRHHRPIAQIEIGRHLLRAGRVKQMRREGCHAS
jgi:hypothetical protein